LTRNALRRAELCGKEGKKRQAAALYAWAGAYHQAARIAVEIGDERRAVRCALRAALGRVPAGYEKAGATQAGELLAYSGHHREAIGLFEVARAYRQAADSALRLRQLSRAAQHYERAGMWGEAAACYQDAGRLDSALRVLELGSNRLRQESRDGPAAAAGERLRAVEARRAEILCKLGRATEAVEVLHDVKPTAQVVDVLEAAGRYEDAMRACLEIGDCERAARLLRKDPDVDRRLAARVYLEFGRPLEAAQTFAVAGLNREAAEAYQAGGDWSKAGSRWEAARDQERAAQAYLKAGRQRDAARCFIAAGRPLLAATSYAQAGDHATAAALYCKAGQLLNAATSLLAAGDRAAAARVLFQIQPGEADYQEASLALIPLLLEERLFEDALRRARRLSPTDGREIRQRLRWESRALEGLGRLAEAEQAYRRLLELAPGDLDAADRLRALTARQPPATDIPTAAHRRPTAADPRRPAPQSAGGAPRGHDRRRTSRVDLGPPHVEGEAAAFPGGLSPEGSPGRSPAAGPAGSAQSSPTPGQLLATTPWDPAPVQPLAATSSAPAPSQPLTTTPSAPSRDRLPAATPASPAPGQLPAAPSGLRPGQLLAGRYELLCELGRGGMGRVYKAHDRELDEPVAIKTLLGQPDDSPVETERLLRELQICRKITHPNVVRVFDLGRFEGGVFITMELLEGELLDRLAARAGRLPLPRIKAILGEIGAGLEEAHALGVVHRDLKPSNIMVTPSRLKILDFGIARMVGVESRLTKTGFALGSVLYISPEQLQGAVADCRTDLYSLGVIAYTLIAGQEPYQGESVAAIALKHLQQPPPDPRRERPDLPAGWPELVERLLSKRPADRYQSVHEVLEALAALPA
jgi:tetratricopeptide (TPR) repeat protein